jgi:hypothetical protein
MKEKQPREKKDKIMTTIDFINSDDVDIHALFAEGSTSIHLTKTAEKDMELDGGPGKFLLPEDYDYSFTDLFKLFMKPKWTVNDENNLLNPLYMISHI